MEDFDTNLLDENDLETPIDSVIDLDEINSTALNMANIITERLSNYYFDEQYIKSHPYIPTKIQTEMNNIRRLLKMLAINERAQDILIQSISFTPSKASLFMSLNQMQSSMISVQKQLLDFTESLETIFKTMQEECEKTFKEKDKEIDDGTMVVRGSKDFIRSLTSKYKNDVTC